MSFQEKSAWILLLVCLIVGGLYGQSLIEAGGIGAESWILTAIIIFIVLAIVIHIAVSILFYRDSDKSDERDRRIARRADIVGAAVLNATLLLIIALSLKEENWMVANIAFLGLLLAEGVKAFWQVILYRVEG